MAALAAIYLYAFPYFERMRSANELPRVLTTVQLVEHHTVRLDSRMSDFGSKWDIANPPDGHFYQNKAPGLSFLGVAAYGPLALAFELADKTPSLRLATWLLRIVVVTLPSLVFLGTFRVVAARFARDEASQRGALAAYALGSMAFAYSVLFMSHVPAAVAVGVAFERAIRLTRGEARSPVRAAFLVGALLGVAVFIEYQAVFAAIIIGAFAVVRAPGGRGHAARVAAAVAISAAPFACALAAYQAVCFGSPLRTGYAYSADAANRAGFMGIVGPSFESLAQLFTHASNGIGFVSPWTLLVPVGVLTILSDPEARARIGAETVVAVLVVLVYVVFVASLVPEFGRAGWSVGPRYIAITMPFLAWLAGAGLAALDDPRGGLDDERLNIAVRAFARATVLAGVIVNVVAVTTFPHWPSQLVNPLYELSFRLLRHGYAPHSLGTLLGLRGLASLVPLYAAVAWLALDLLWRRRPRAELGAGLVIAAAILCGDRYIPKATDDAVQSKIWNDVTAWWEP